MTMGGVSTRAATSALTDSGAGEIGDTRITFPRPTEIDPTPDRIETAIASTHVRPTASGRRVADLTIHATGLTAPEKAAILARLLLAAGDDSPITGLPPEQAARLIRAMCCLKPVSAETTLAVIDEFLENLGPLNLRFPTSIEDALALLPSAPDDEVRSLLFGPPKPPEEDTDNWGRIAALDVDLLVEILSDQTPQVCAILLSRLKPTLSAEIVSRLDEAHANATLVAAATMGQISQETLTATAQALMQIVDARNQTGPLPGSPVERVAEIMNFTPGSQRDALLEKLAESDPEMAEEIRKNMFTFADIPARINENDVSKVVRAADNQMLVTALKGAGEKHADVVDFLLGNISKRLAEQLREEVGELPPVTERDADAAMNTIIATIRDLEQAGEITLVLADEEDESARAA